MAYTSHAPHALHTMRTRCTHAARTRRAPAVVREYRAECRGVDLEQSARLIVEPLRRAAAAFRATTARVATACVGAARAALR